MITYPGYDDIIRRVYDHQQGHVFEYWTELDDAEKKFLLDDLSDIDYELIVKLFSSREGSPEADFEPAPWIPVPATDEEKKSHDAARAAGVEHIRRGKVAAFVVAGGQGSRLGYEGPKGKFPVGPVSNSTLFQIHGWKILKYNRKYRVRIPYLVMTSRANHEETVLYFKENNFFGLSPEDVFIFPQNMIPSLDSQGKLIMETKKSVFKNPDGHGGSLTALYTSGVLAELKKRGIETVSYFQVDNPLVRIIDPVFIGFHVTRGADISSKAVKKAGPDEKVGVFVRYGNNSVGVVEYSDMPAEKTRSVNPDGELKYNGGSIAIHLFRREFIERVTAGVEIALPFHTAKKKIKALTGGAVREIDGFKFEKFVFDALPLTEKNIVFETPREDEFAPVKNASGIDSVESARRLMINQHRRWLEGRGIVIPAKASFIEISPLLAVEPEDVPPDLVVPTMEKVYLKGSDNA